MSAQGRYELLDRIAVGGMAELFRARAIGEHGIAKLLAVKRIRPPWANDQAFVRMLVEEARLAAALSHPNIVQVFELGRDAGGYFIAMELVNGPNLSTLLRRLAAQGRFLPEACALDIVIQVLQGLDYAHRQADPEGRPLRLVHRDVSPENLLVTVSGTVKLADFGIAKARTSPQQTLIGTPKGKPRYMSPEQARGDVVDGRSDLFAAGLVLWECLTGRPRFDATNELALLAQVAENRFTAPSELGFQLAPALESALEHALASSRDDRFQTAAEFARELTGHHRRTFPDYVPEVLGALVQELYGSDLALLESKLHRLQTGVEELAGYVGTIDVQAEVTEPATIPPAARTVPNPEVTQPNVAPPATALPAASAPGPGPAQPVIEAAATLGDAVVPTARPLPPQAAGTAATQLDPGQPGAKPAYRKSATASSAPSRREAEARQIDQAIAEAKAAERAEGEASRRIPLPILIGAFLAVGVLSGGVMALLEPSEPTATTAPGAAAAPQSPAAAALLPEVAVEQRAEPPAKPVPAPPSRPALPEGPVRTGLFDLACEPDCEVLLHGKIVGHAPLVGFELPAGRHRIVVRNRLANLSKTMTVEIEPEQTTTRTVNLVLDP